ncbi:MAG: hypothetical protein O3A92_12375 [Verrucomicrobia bacterium]|nr:hypothetical protein [Verrucomicrobiota bacterium]
MDIPLEIRLSLRQGTVYYMAERQLTSIEPHYFVVVNREPLRDRVLLLLVVTSQVEKARQRVARKTLPAETLVEIRQTEYGAFSKDSCVDCNKVFTKSLEELCQQWTRKEIRGEIDLPPILLGQLVRGVQASPLVTGDEKSKVLPLG